MRRPWLLCSLLLWACPPEAILPEPPHLLWSADAQSLDNPFPDERLFEGGVARFRRDWYRPFFPAEREKPELRGYMNKVARQAAEEVRAFGNFGTTLLPSSHALDPASLAGCARRLVREGDGWRMLEADVPVAHSSALLTQHGLTYPEGWPEFIAVRPRVPLPEGREGLLVVLRGPKTVDGEALGRGAAHAAAQAPDAAALTALGGVRAEDVIYFQPLRAGEVSAPLKKLAAWAEANPAAVTIPPKANPSSGPVGRWRRSDADWSALNPWLERNGFGRPAAHVGTVLLGEFAARDLREGGRFKAEWVEDPSLAPVVPLRFVATFPDGPKPEGGWPMVLGAHGVGARNTPQPNGQAYCLEWAEQLAKRGLGCVGIDAVEHGSRGSFAEFFSLSDLPALRDRFREMTFDLLQLERIAVTLDADGARDAALTTRYFGNSLGSIMGANFVPFGNRLTSVGLNVPGAGLSNLVTSPNLLELIGFLLIAEINVSYQSPEFYLAFSLVKAAGQPFFDPGDPINVVHNLRPEVALLQQSGLNDQILPNDTNFDLANALGLPDAVPASGSAPLRAFMFVEGEQYGKPADYNGHGAMWDLEVIRAQMLDFLASDGRTLTVP